MQELADSISELGVIQPITLRKEEDGNYMIIAGERRFRASQLAGKTTIPAYILSANEKDTMEMALIENIQREDLNPLEIALAYQQLIEQYNLSQEQLSKRVGKGRATIANSLRLLKLPGNIQVALKERVIDMGHAKALLSLSSHADQIRIFNETIKNGYSVRCSVFPCRSRSLRAGTSVQRIKNENNTMWVYFCQRSGYTNGKRNFTAGDPGTCSGYGFV
mgnify:CR=1 FL=1